MGAILAPVAYREVGRGALFCALFTVVLGALAAAPAAAQIWTGERWVRGRPHRVEGDGALYVNGNTVAFSPSVFGRFRLVDSHRFARTAFIMDFDLAWRGIAVAGPHDSFRVGNPYVGLRLGARGPNWVARGGLGTTAPLTNAFHDGADDLRAYQLGQGMYGAWDAWLLEPGIQPLVMRGDFEIHSRYVIGGFDAALGVIFPAFTRHTSEFAFQTGAFGAITPIPELAIGARLALFFATDWAVGFGGVDEAQLSLIPFVRLDLVPFFLEARLLMNLDHPFGFAFDPGGVYAISVSAGGRF